jgi:hypothetical protein
MLIKVNLKKKCIVAASAERVEENAIEELNKSLQMTSDFCAKMDHSAIMHAKVFDKYIFEGHIRNKTNALYSPR